MNWTDDQRRAIEFRGTSLLVSAGAGAGKTAVLAERCASLVADDRPPCAIDRLLVLTFTDAAAAEMRSRIGDALRKRLEAQAGNRWIAEQLALVDLAHVSTIHAFCRRILSRHFAAAGLDPAFRVLDETDALLLRDDVLTELLHDLERGGRPESDAYEALLAELARGSSDAVKAALLQLGQLLESVVDPQTWLEHQRARFEGLPADRVTGEWLEVRRTLLDDELAVIEGEVQRLTTLWNGDELLRPFADRIAHIREEVATWRREVRNARDGAALDRLCGQIAAGIEVPHAPRLTKAIKSKSAASQAAFKNAQREYGKLRERLTKSLGARYAGMMDADWAGGLARVAPHVRALIDLVRKFRERYQREKTSAGVVDFADLERRMLDLLRRDEPPVAEWLRKQFEHVLVDEYQDINPVQAEIIRLVSRESDPSPGRAANLFAVGDVKQSIYRFRLAEPAIFLDRLLAAHRAAATRQPGPAFIPLNRNFRSTAPLLDFVNAVFERLMSSDFGQIEYDAHARLVPGTLEQQAARRPAVEMHLLGQAMRVQPEESDGDAMEWDRVEREAYCVAQRIHALRADDPSIAFGDIAVLMRSARHHGPLLVRTLGRCGIPVVAELASAFFDSTEVRDALALLELLDNAQQDIPLAAVCRSPFAPQRISDSDLARIAAWSGPQVPFHRAAMDFAERGNDEAMRGRLAALFDRLHDWRTRIRRRPLPDVLAEILDETGYRHYAAVLPDGPQRLANLVTLHEHARRFATFQRQGLHRFLNYLRRLQQDEEDLGAVPPSAPTTDAVRVMTIHRSKGLEFPVVCVVELGRQFNLNDTRGSLIVDRDAGIGLKAADLERRIIYPTLAQESVARHVRLQSLAEEMRTLYVALTRARKRLVLVGTVDRSRIERARAAASDRPQPLPLVARTSAQCYLDWLLPAISAMPPADVSWPGESSPSRLLTMAHYDLPTMDSWSIEPGYSEGVRARLKRFARLDAADDVLPDDDAREQIERIMAETRYAPLTRVPAVVAASALKQTQDARETDGPAAPFEPSPPWARMIEPSFLAGEESETGDAAARGTSVHRFLEWVDLARPCDAADLARQRDALRAAGVLSAADAAALDLEALAWFFATPLGAALRDARREAQREMTFVDRLPPEELDPRCAAADDGDFVLLRGTIDCWFRAGDGAVVLDYKTDAVDPGGVGVRAALYAPQLKAYARAVERTCGVRVMRKSLVFLTPRVIWDA